MIHIAGVLLRDGRPSDHPLVIDSWLNANKATPRAREMLAAGVYWTEYKAIVRRLLSEARLTVACDEGDEDAILGWLCASAPPPDNPDPLVHYVYVRGGKRGARRCGIARALLADFLTHPCTYTHRPTKDGLPIPDDWQFNPERIYR